MSNFSPKPLEQCVVIVGVGLIGGSLAAALRRRGLVEHVIGVGRNRERLEAARAAGLIDESATSLASAVSRADVVVFCTPVDRVAEGVREAAAVARPGTLLTDAGSVKGPICNAVADVPSFVGAHPIAGSHRQGFEAADADLFQDRVCVVTPAAHTDPGRTARTERLWQAVGMRTLTMSPAAHDRALARTSHLPHVVAAALARTLTADNVPLTGTGFRDATRIAAGDPDLWTAILLQNAPAVVDGLTAVLENLAQFVDALRAGDAIAVREQLLEGQQARAWLDPG